MMRLALAWQLRDTGRLLHHQLSVSLSGKSSAQALLSYGTVAQSQQLFSTSSDMTGKGWMDLYYHYKHEFYTVGFCFHRANLVQNQCELLTPKMWPNPKKKFAKIT